MLRCQGFLFGLNITCYISPNHLYFAHLATWLTQPTDVTIFALLNRPAPPCLGATPQ